MPLDFIKCVKQKGSKVITIKPKKDAYINVCYDKKGKAHAGEVKHLKKECEDELANILELEEESTTNNIPAGKDNKMGTIIRPPLPTTKKRKKFPHVK
jgi:hypothetical protein